MPNLIDRRAALGAVASAVPVLAFGAGAALASPVKATDDADAPLFALLDQWRAAEERVFALDDRLDNLRGSLGVACPDALVRTLADAE